MKNDSALMRMSRRQLILHEIDKKYNPERHWLTKDVYTKAEMLDLCIWCADHYDWNKQIEYDARSDSYYKKKDK